MKRLTFLLLFASTGTVLAACDDPVWDQANVLSQADSEKLNEYAVKLKQLGADPHFVIRESTSDTAEMQKNALYSQCPAWVSLYDGKSVPDSNLIFLGVSLPNGSVRGKSWIAYGASYHDKLDAHQESIRMVTMNTPFRNHQWGLGLAQGANKIIGYMEAPPTPPYEFPFALVFKWLACIMAAVAVFFVALFARRGSKERLIAQRAAVARRNLVGTRLRAVEAQVTAYGQRDPVPINAEPVLNYFNSISEDFSKYSQSETLNPDSKQPDVEAYKTIDASFHGLETRLDNCEHMLTDRHPVGFSGGSLFPQRSGPPTSTFTPRIRHRPSNPPPPPNVVVVERDNSNTNLTAGLLGYELGRDSERSSYREPERESYRSRDPDPPSSSSDSWSSSSSDSGSSSGSDFGGSSDSGGGSGGDF